MSLPGNRSYWAERRESSQARQTMRRLGPRAGRAAVLVVPVAALSLSLGTGPAQASAQGVGLRHAMIARALPATGVSWQKLTLANGWQSGQSLYGTGNPAWAIQGGVVYLSGSIVNGSGLITILPSQARPSHLLFIRVYTSNDTTGYLTIDPNGDMLVTSSPSSTSTAYTSLAGVSFPAPSLAQAKVTLIDNWHSSQGTEATGDPSYAVKGGVVYLSGSLHRSAGSSQQFAQLPSSARPTHSEFFTVYTYDGASGGLLISPDGDAYAYAGSAASFTSLAGVSYPAASAAKHALTLVNGWKSARSIYGTGDPAYSLIGGVVHLSGSLHQANAGSQVFAVLPPGDRPAHALYITTFTGAPSFPSVGTVLIQPNGAMFAYSPTPSNARALTSLEGISFPLGS